MSIALSILSLVGMAIVAGGIYLWRREGLSWFTGPLILGGVALVIFCVVNRANQAQFIGTLRPSLEYTPEESASPPPKQVEPPRNRYTRRVGVLSSHLTA
jgi:phosphate/sulfate permease